MNVNEALAKALCDLQVETIFGLLGDGNLWLVDTYVRELGGQFVAATHEATAVQMASGFAKRSGCIAVATITHGPALTNSLTSLTNAARGRTSMVLIVGDTPAEMRDHSQNISQRDVVLPTGAGFEQVRSARTSVVDLHHAFRRAFDESRPIVLNVPREFYLEDVDVIPSSAKLPLRQATRPDPRVLDDALGIMASARRPILLAGRGAAEDGTREVLIRLADQLGAALATTLQGQELFSGHEYAIGVFGSLSSELAIEVISQSDCIVAFGASLNSHTTLEGAYLKDRAVIHCDVRPEAFSPAATVSIMGDSKAIAEEMIAALTENDISGTGYRTPAWRDRMAAGRAASLRVDPGDSELDVRAALAYLNDVIPAERSMTTDLGRFVIDTWKAMRVPYPQAYVHTTDFGSIGLGMGYAIGMTFAQPGSPVVLVTGDGGFMLGGLAEFATAARYHRDLIVLVVNDGAYGAEHIQFRNRDMDPGITTFDWPDFAALAEVLGGRGCTVRTPGDLDAAAQAILHRTKPVLIDLVVRPESVLQHGYA